MSRMNTPTHAPMTVLNEISVPEDELGVVAADEVGDEVSDGDGVEEASWMPVAEPESGAAVVFWARAVSVGVGLPTTTDPETPLSVCRFRRGMWRNWDIANVRC